ncbi:MAG: electron transfer flavoprotein subunit alpha/FixB family protein [Deltaproteobacteria bacterium]|nr:electron transfer flavoprotein subunit alpha/FixB family protein [Deltaproteobacteria bacterium]
MAEYKGVMTYCEIAEGSLPSISREVAGFGRKLADDLGEELCAVLVGSDVGNLAQDAIGLGADTVYVVDDPLLKEYQTDAYLSVMEKVVRKMMPRILILGQTSVGRDLAPMLAFRLDTTATLDCVGLAIDPGTKLLLQTKPVFGGNAQATFTSDFCPQIVTVRDKLMPPPEPDASKQGEVITLDAGLDPAAIRASLLKRVTENEGGVRLEDASIIVSGGRGIGSAEGFDQLQELAALLKGAVGASRPACDNRWLAPNRQVGITGKIVNPDLYIAIALSGSIQHLSGCAQSKSIIAINKDPEAPIFNYADFGVVGDWKKVLPAFRDKLKELLPG